MELVVFEADSRVGVLEVLEAGVKCLVNLLLNNRKRKMKGKCDYVA